MIQNSKNDKRRRVIAGIAGLASAVIGSYIILTTNDAQAGIGFIFLPFVVLTIGGGAYCLDWGIMVLITWLKVRLGSLMPLSELRVAILSTVIVASVFVSLSLLVINRHTILTKAASRNTSATEITHLFTQAQTNHDVDLLARLAGNPGTPRPLLRELYSMSGVSAKSRILGSRYEYVLSCVAANPSTPAEVLESMAIRGSSRVRLSLAFNWNTPVNVLRRLEADSDHFVSRAAKENLERRTREAASAK